MCIFFRNCPHCKTLRKATKQLSLSRLPPVLLIQLKRFSFNGPFTDKLETAVDYPVKGLDLTKYIPPIMPGSESDKSLSATDPRRQEPPYFYDLYGVTNHFGTLSSGHCKLTSTIISGPGRSLYYVFFQTLLTLLQKVDGYSVMTLGYHL